MHGSGADLPAIIRPVPAPSARGNSQTAQTLFLEKSMFKKLVPVLGALLLAGSLAATPVAAVAAQAPTTAHHVVHKKMMHKKMMHKKWAKKAMHKKWHKKVVKHPMAKKKG
jgi:hypothetical protein